MNNKHFYGKSILEIKHTMLSNRYKGFGRPRKTDYDYLTLMEMQRKIDAIFNQMIDHRIIGGNQ